MIKKGYKIIEIERISRNITCQGGPRGGDQKEAPVAPTSKVISFKRFYYKNTMYENNNIWSNLLIQYYFMTDVAAAVILFHFAWEEYTLMMITILKAQTIWQIFFIRDVLKKLR